MEKVSIIIPAYNAEKTLESCVLSVLEQEYPVYEIIIINDGSTDHTKDICDRLSIDEKVIVVHQDNKGVSLARNIGLSLISGDYVVFIDSDDIVEPDYIGTLMSSCDFDFVTAGFYMQDSESIWHIYEFSDESITVEYLKKFPSKYMGKYYFGGPVGKLFKRDIIEKNEIRFNEGIHSGEDTLFIFEYLNCSKSIRIIPLSGYKYFYYGTSLAHRFHKDYWKWKLVVEKKIQDFFAPDEIDEKKYMLCRNFAVLKDLLERYYEKIPKSEMNEYIYSISFFAECIQLKKKEGTFEEKLLIYVMSYNNYSLYVKYLTGKRFVNRCIGYVGRKLHI